MVRETERGRWHRAATRCVGLALAAAAVACTSGDGDSTADGGVQVTVDSTGGVHRVTSSGTPPAWSLEPLLTLERAGEEEFGRITGVIGDWAGNVYVADALARRIHRFDNTGALLVSLGGEGAGPGEFRSMRGLAFVGGKVASLDAGNGRITLLPPDGEGAPEAVRWQALTGDVALEQTAPGEAYAPVVVAQPGERVSRSRTYLRLIGAGTPDTLQPSEALLPTSPRVVTCEGQGALHFYGVPYDMRGFLAPAPGGRVVAGNTGSYRLALLSPAGDTARVIARDIAPAAVSDAEWAEVEVEWAEFQERTRGTRCNESGITRPATKPAFATAFFDDRGRLWVEAWETSGFRFDVFDTTGALVGSMPAPARDRAVRPYIRTGRLYYVALDSLDVPAVHVARIVEDAATATADP